MEFENILLLVQGEGRSPFNVGSDKAAFNGKDTWHKENYVRYYIR